MKNIILVIVGILLCAPAISQNCDCIIDEVEANTVSPCNYTIGAVVTVTTAAEFISAVNQANNTGGNMTILIADGTYQVASTSWYPYITANNVVFRGLSGNRDAVIITGNGMLDVAPNTEIGIYAVGDNITIADLTIKDVGNHAIAVTGDNLYVYNVKIQDSYEQMIKGNSSGNGIDNGVVKCSLFEYTNGIGPQWYIGGLDIHTGTNWSVSDNVFRDISSPSNTLAEHAIHFWDSSSDNLVERNKIVNCDRGIGFGLGNSSNDGGTIKNNMITNDGTNIFDDVGIGLESSPNTNVYNNSIFIDYPNAIEYRFAATTNVQITNNVTNKIIKSRNGGTATLTTNNTNALNSWFVSTTTGDLHLASNVPALVDMGSDIADVTIDIDKFARPQFSENDIGASEFQIPLAVEYLSPLRAILVDKQVLLNWVSANEKNNDYFLIQRSQNTLDWKTIEQVKGTGSSYVSQNYRAYDTNTPTGNLYYRLKQMDFDGTHSYSNIASIFIKNSDFQVYPNPTTGIVFIPNQFLNKNYKVVSPLGIIVKKGIIDAKEIDLSELKSGIHILKITDNKLGDIKIARIIKE